MKRPLDGKYTHPHTNDHKAVLAVPMKAIHYDEHIYFSVAQYHPFDWRTLKIAAERA